MVKINVLAGLMAAVTAGGASAQTPSTVDVTLGPAVQARLNELGPSELSEQGESLRHQVVQALARSPLRVRSVNLVIQDIQPNRPTSAELGASAGLQHDSFGLGDAAITGQVVAADGSVRPIRYRYAPPDLQQASNPDTWGDAQEAFARLAHDLGRGVVPDQTGAWPPPHRATAPTGSLIVQ